MRRFLLITLGVIFGGSALLALYVVWPYDPDDISPTVDALSYEAMFRLAVKQRAGTDYDALDEDRRTRMLEDLLTSGETDPVKEVALARVRRLGDKEAALRMVSRRIDALTPEQFEVAVASIAALGAPKATAFLDTLYRKLDADPAAHIPLGGYRTASLRATTSEDDVVIKFNERSRNDADYAFDKASELTYFFPRDPEYFLSIPNADDMIERFKDSRFAVSLENSPVAEDIWALPMLRTIDALRDRLTTSMGFMGEFFAPEKLFRDNLSIGAYGNHYLLATFKDKNVEVAKTLIGIFETLGADFGVRRWEVEGNTISAVASRKTGSTLCYATVDDYFIVATDTALISRSVRTFADRRTMSLAIDPLFSKEYLTVDQSGKGEAFFAWFNPTRYFDMIGADRQKAQRLAVVARALGKPLTSEAPNDGAAGQVADVPGVFGSLSAGGESPEALWRYVVDVRSLGRNAIDSLARLSRIDVGRQIIPYLASNIAIGYSGVDYLRQPYGYANTSFGFVSAFPLRNPPARFDSTLRVFFSRITSLQYTVDVMEPSGVRLWLASDTAVDDTVLMARKLQPSFAVVDNRVLLIASTPSLLRLAATEFLRRTELRPTDSRFLSGTLRVDSFAVNSARYLRAYLSRGDRYTPREIADRTDRLADALKMYDRLQWEFTVHGGLRQGEARLHARKSG